jgi:VanZ family protein
LIRWLALGLWYAAIVFTSSLASAPVTNQAWSDLLVSKAGHVAVYGLLGWLAIEAVSVPAAGLALGRRGALLVTILLGAALAALDETRQSFVYGRTGLPSDVLLDTAALSGGALLHQWLHRPLGAPALAQAAHDSSQQRAVEDQHQELHREDLAVAVDVRQERHHDRQVDQHEQVERQRP